MKTQLELFLSSCRDGVFRHVRAYLEKRTAPLPPAMRACVKDYPYRRGKALRPALALLFARAYGGRPGPALKVASAYQLLEDWGLGRDDILDGGQLRRGLPALHLRYGLPRALNALDMLHDCVFDMLYVYCRLPAGEYGRVRAIFAEATEVTLGGQHLDIEAREIPLEKFTPGAYLRIAERKTAFYTVTVPCLLGAELAGARGQSAAIREFGRLLGAAFQITDDVLDAENDGTGLFGKAPGNDILEGKRTLVALEAFRRLPPAAARRLARLYSLPPAAKSAAAVAAARRAILASGAPAACRARAQALTAAAAAVFEKSLLPAMRPPGGRLIAEFIQALGRRTF
ncbi:MAG: hypothetical protein A2X29_11765 [Elusimicrobia bacterium GWA2_64_40]|nr:MAG: hypothetical protein A2X29_11765 [Elusimicrobia bacterium GWA2_64_40]OGR67441.1 MAG: hypothetical protein A2X30_05815 [Elusimicrobia bacterium GWB2_63_16]HAN05337.1 geranylgeranyl diphosphate synthase [Elusimicrobiota bacterium]